MIALPQCEASISHWVIEAHDAVVALTECLVVVLIFRKFLIGGGAFAIFFIFLNFNFERLWEFCENVTIINKIFGKHDLTIDWDFH